MDISGTSLRAVRAALFTALVVTLGTASHVLLSQAPLPLNTVALLAGAVFAVAYTLAGRERTFGRIAAVLIPLELAADTVLTTGQHVCYGRAGGPVAGPLASVGWDVLCGDHTEVGAPLVRAGTDPVRLGGLLNQIDPVTSWLLLGVHIGVGLLAAVWLRKGERALARLLGAVAATTFRPLLTAVAAVVVPVAIRARLPRPSGHRPAARSRFLVHSPRRRGPPRSPAVVHG